MPLDIDLNQIYNNESPTDSVQIDLNVCPPCEEEANVDLNINPSYEENNVDLNVVSSYEGEEGTNDLMNVSLPYEEIFHENEVEAHSFINHIDNHGDSISLNEATGNVENETQPLQKKRSFLDNTQRRIISEILINSSCEGKLNRGIVKKVAFAYSVSTDVIYRIWRQINETGDACHKKTKNCGRKRVEIDFEKIRDIPLAKRSTYQSLAKALGVKSKSVLEKYVAEGVLRRHSSTLKPHMKDDNKKERLRFCLSMLEESSIPHDPMFKSMYNIVHIDEKWFEMTKKSTSYYLLADEEDPYRTCKNKNYIPKVMFLVALARPRFNDEDEVTFTGKIGLFPLVNKVPARRSSVNRATGTLETKPITSITFSKLMLYFTNSFRTGFNTCNYNSQISDDLFKYKSVTKP